MSDWLTAQEAAAEMRCHEKTVRRMINRGEISARFVAGRYLIHRNGLPLGPPPRPKPPRRRPNPNPGPLTQLVREMEAAS